MPQYKRVALHAPDLLEARISNVVTAFKKSDFNQVYYDSRPSKALSELQAFLETQIQTQPKNQQTAALIHLLHHTLDIIETTRPASHLFCCYSYNMLNAFIAPATRLKLRLADYETALNIPGRTTFLQGLFSDLLIHTDFVSGYRKNDFLFGLYPKRVAAHFGMGPYYHALQNTRQDTGTGAVRDIFNKIHRNQQGQKTLPPREKHILNFLSTDPGCEKSIASNTPAAHDWKYLSKGIIRYTLYSNDPARLHFCLDNIDMTRVLGKQRDADGGHLLTGSELRLLYREWLKHPQPVAYKIVFWEKGKSVPAPWIQAPEIWQAYTPSFIQKNRSHPPTAPARG